MDAPQAVDLSHRLLRLEIAVVVLAASLLVLVLVLLTGRAFRRQVVPRDPTGDGRHVEATSDAGDPEITMRARDTASWLRIGFDRGGPMLVMADRSGEVRFRLSMEEGGPSFSMANDRGETRMFAGYFGDQIPGMVILDRLGKGRIELSEYEPGGPYLQVYDGSSTRRLALGIAPDGDPAVVFFGKQGKERMGFGFDANGDPFLHILDEEGRLVSRIPPIKTGRVAQGGFPPPEPPQIRTCPTQASGSSCHDFAT